MQFYFILISVLKEKKPKERRCKVFSATMAYVERGVVRSKRSFWRLKTVVDFFWSIINFIGVFFTTMFSMEKLMLIEKDLVLARNGMMVALEVPEVVHMAHVGHLVERIMLEGLITAPFLRVALAVEVEAAYNDLDISLSRRVHFCNHTLYGLLKRHISWNQPYVRLHTSVEIHTNFICLKLLLVIGVFCICD
ncbi:uncharacterized protein LOC142551702 [Primulina tabacum]|uniref:uncharacterized protein LOC142551702 n=1 Tax=Primulina tabacum TaxID=48773 RepID=UPI003F595303